MKENQKAGLVPETEKAETNLTSQELDQVSGGGGFEWNKGVTYSAGGDLPDKGIKTLPEDEA